MAATKSESERVWEHKNGASSVNRSNENVERLIKFNKNLFTLTICSGRFFEAKPN